MFRANLSKIFTSNQTFTEYRVRTEVMQILKLAETNHQEANNVAIELTKKIPAIQANQICNNLLRKDTKFRDFCFQSTLAQMQATTPLLKWKKISEQGKFVPLFRGIDNNNTNYSDPIVNFKEGMPVSLLNTRSAKHIAYSLPRVITYETYLNANNEIDVRLPNNFRIDMFGFFFGPVVSTSLNLGYVAEQRYALANTRYQKDRYIFLIALEDGFNVADVIYDGVGYIHNRQAGLLGQKGTSNAEDACEVGAGNYVFPQRIIGFREISKDGNLSEFYRNSNSSDKVFSQLLEYVEVRVFLEVKTLDELRMIETLMLQDKNKVENYNKKIITYHNQDEAAKQQIQLDARNAKENKSVSLLLKNDVTLFSETQVKIIKKVETYKKAVEKGELKDSKSTLFHAKKSENEAELKQRAIKASEQQNTKNPVINATPVFSLK